MRVLRPSNVVFHAAIAVVLATLAGVIGVEATPWGAWPALAPVAVMVWIALRRPVRRWRAVSRPLADAQRAWLMDHVPLFSKLDAAHRHRFERDVRIVLAEWRFEGVDDVEVTVSLRMGVAAGVALLTLGRPDWEPPSRHTVLFYPGSFDEDYLPADDAHFSGMAHRQGPVIISVQAFEEGWARPHDGNNVVLHELAHLLDYRAWIAEAVGPDALAAWRRLVLREMQAIKIGRSLLRRYAATNPYEFFAVAVENFYERPAILRRRHPKLYDAMARIFNLDPGALLGEATSQVQPPADSGTDAAT